MKRWMKAVIVTLVLAVPVTAYAYHQYSAQQSCPATSGCPCGH